MLQKQNVTIKLNEGVDTRDDDKLVSGNIEALQNAYITKAGGFKKRWGQTSLVATKMAGGSISSARKLDTHKDQLVLIDESSDAYSYSETVAKWSNVGSISPLQINSKDILSSQGQGYTAATMCEVAIVGNYEIHAFLENANVYFTTIDRQDGTVLVSRALVIVGSVVNSFKIRNINNRIWIIYGNPTLLAAKEVLSSSNYTTLGGAVTIATDLEIPSNEACFDVDTFSTSAVVAFSRAGNTIGIRTIDDSCAIVNSANIAATGNQDYNYQISVKANSTNIAIVWDDGAGNIYYAIYSQVLAVVVAAAVAHAGAAGVVFYNVSAIWSVSPDTTLYVYSGYSTSPEKVATYVSIYSGAMGARAYYSSFYICSKPFVISGVNYFVVKTVDPTQPTEFLVRQTDALVMSVHSQGESGTTDRTGFLKQGFVQVISNKAYYSTVKYFFKSATLQGLDTRTIKLVEFDFNLPQVQSAYFQNTLVLNGGLTCGFDGASVNELGFLQYPAYVDDVTDIAGNIPAGTYNYRATYAWIDANGQEYESAFSLNGNGKTKTFAVASNYTVNIPNLLITKKPVTGSQGITIKLYRLNPGDSVYYLTKQVSQSTGPFTQITDDNATISSNQVLYTTGGIIENIAPPASRYLTASKNRLFLAPSEDSNAVWYSKPFSLGYGIQLSDLLTLRAESSFAEKPVSAIYFMDDKLIIFKNSCIFAVAGDGPNNAGQQDTFSTPQLISTDAGCENPRSIVLFPNGLMFKSPKGIYMLSRGLQVEYAGIRAEAYNSFNIVGGELFQPLNQIRWVTSANNMIVFDYLLNEWFLYMNYSGNDSVIWKNKYCVVTSAGIVKQEIENQYTDDGAAINIYLETSWLELQDVQDFQRVHRILILGDYYSAHTLTLKSYVDYDSSSFDSYTLTPSLTPPYQYRVHLKRQKCETIKFSIQENNLVTLGQGLSMAALTFEIGAKKGGFKTASTKQA